MKDISIEQAIKDEQINLKDIKSCPVQFVLAVNDALNVLTGKWKLPIIGALLFKSMRFSEMKKTIPKITSRMLSKELKELELNGVVKRVVDDTTPVTITYQLTDSGMSLNGVLDKILEWGLGHRNEFFSQA
ncbi:winged helix-turn-helix transcriptional regulator [Crocinitomix catalasitica]|uniref:winged helix-turn-helix transcriptional regulator n=1 Tax=Crocinitomix catalasitica TaxID=184607 RepID=UPI00068473E4|nr:helix-turn-helix domain-containing protein [Crocinitomix catalasitica]